MATDLKRVQNPKPQNFVGKYLKYQIDEYVLSDKSVTRARVFRDLAKVLGCTPDAIDNWYEGRNGVKHMMAEKLAFLFETTLDRITDNGEYTPPATPPNFDKPAFAKNVLATTNLHAMSKDNLQVEDLRRDLRETATQYLRSVGKLRDPLTPASAPIGDRMPLLEEPKNAPVGPMASCDARPGPVPDEPDTSDIPEQGEAFFEKANPKKLEPVPHTSGERQAVAERPQTLAGDTERNQIKMFLHQAEIFRRNNNLEWFMDGDKLRARRVVTEEF